MLEDEAGIGLEGATKRLRKSDAETKGESELGASEKAGLENGDENENGEERGAAGSESLEEQPGDKEGLSEEKEELSKEARGIEPGGESKGPECLEEDEAWVEEVPVCSAVLAAKSSVLRAMLSNGMRESDRNAPVVLKVKPEEKLAFKELLRFVYVARLSPALLQPTASVRSLVDLLTIGDKFAVGSLMGAALAALASRERTVSDDVILALDVPDALEQYPEVKAVVTGARSRTVATFKEVDTWHASLEFLTLGLEAVAFLLRSEQLEAASEEEVFEGVLVWVKNNRGTEEAARDAMARLSQHIRFGCMKGEYLIRSVLPRPELALEETQERVRAGIDFRALSDEEKLKSEDVSAQLRKGIQGRSFEICCNFVLDESGTTKFSPKSVWMGKHWCMLLEKSRSDPPTVDASGNPSELSDEGVESKPIKFDFKIFCRVWPSGYWKLLHDFSPVMSTESTLSKEVIGWGCSDSLGMAWDDVRKSE